MKNKRIVALLLALCVMFALCACGAEDKNDAPAAEVPATDVPAAPTAAPTEPAEEETQPAGITYTVKVQDEGGNPVVGAMIQICQGELCMMPAATDAAGAAVFTVAEEAAYEAKFLSMPAGYDYTTEEQVFPFNGAFELTITLKAVA